MIKFLVAPVAWFCLAASLMAEDAPVRPAKPYLAKLPAETSWRMDFTPLGAAASGNPPPGQPAVEKALVVVKDGAVRRDVTTFSDGTRLELWSARKLFFLKTPQSAQYGVYLPGDTPYDDGYPDFPDLGWVNAGNFKDVETKNGVRCFAYFTNSLKGPFYATFPGDPGVPATVWINIATKLPVALQRGQLTGTYIFDLPPTPLTLPDNCQKIIDGIDAGNKRMAGQKMMLPN